MQQLISPNENLGSVIAQEQSLLPELASCWWLPHGPAAPAAEGDQDASPISGRLQGPEDGARPPPCPVPKPVLVSALPLCVLRALGPGDPLHSPSFPASPPPASPCSLLVVSRGYLAASSGPSLPGPSGGARP